MQGTGLILGATVCAALITIFLWTLASKIGLLWWMGAIAVIGAVRLVSIRRYFKASDETRNRRYWGPVFWVGTLLAGIVWGMWPLMFYDFYSRETLLLISTLFAGMVAVSASSGRIYIPSFLSFSMPLVIPLSILHMQSGSDTLWLTGFLLLVFLLVNGALTIQGHGHYLELIKARFQNQSLMESLAQEKHTAEQAVIAKNRFLAAASHDLRQPLHAMGMFLESLRFKESSQDKLAIIEDMSASAQALNGLFNSLLDVSKLDAEIIHFNPTHIDIGEMFERLHVQFKNLAAENGIELHSEHHGCTLYADSILLERVLRNLLSNAICYTKEGKVSLICDSSQGHVARISIIDTGLGIPEQEQEDVFSEYHQLNNPERDRNKGLGLGLAIVRRLCRLMQLEVKMHSQLGVGTRFDLTLPMGNIKKMKTSQPEIGLPSLQNLMVMVIDDEETVLAGMQSMLGQWGCEVVLAESARDALRAIALEQVQPDIIISDYRLRNNCTGVDAIAAVREALETDIPGIVVTGDNSPTRLKEVNDSGLHLLHKPVNPDEMRLAIDSVQKTNSIDAPAACKSKPAKIATTVGNVGAS
ncbi:MAG: hybrid sensor histidine kinase/response regulator [Granulosicoccaceae bacterium]